MKREGGRETGAYVSTLLLADLTVPSQLLETLRLHGAVEDPVGRVPVFHHRVAVVCAGELGVVKKREGELG